MSNAVPQPAPPVRLDVMVEDMVERHSVAMAKTSTRLLKGVPEALHAAVGPLLREAFAAGLVAAYANSARPIGAPTQSRN